MAEQGDQESIEMDSMDQAALDQAQESVQSARQLDSMPLLGGPVADGMLAQARMDIAEVHRRADMKTRLAEASSAGAQMRVDPDQVDKLANFFRDKAAELRTRSAKVMELGNLAPPGTDPASKAATLAYTQVGAGDEQAYLDNYLKLADLFDKTAAELTSNAQQTRSDEQGAKEAFEKGQRA